MLKAIRLLDSPASSQQDKMDGIEYAKASCDAGSMRAATLLGYLNEGDNELLPCNYEEARKYYQLGVDRGSSVSEYGLGRLYLNQNVAFSDENKGKTLILSSAKKGCTHALVYLGDCFREKVTDPKNLDIAYQYYCLAGERGYGLGYHYMGEIDASRQDVELAQKHETAASINGYDPDSSSQNELFSNLHI